MPFISKHEEAEQRSFGNGFSAHEMETFLIWKLKIGVLQGHHFKCPFNHDVMSLVHMDLDKPDVLFHYVNVLMKELPDVEMPMLVNAMDAKFDGNIGPSRVWLSEPMEGNADSNLHARKCSLKD